MKAKDASDGVLQGKYNNIYLGLLGLGSRTL